MKRGPLAAVALATVLAVAAALLLLSLGGPSLWGGGGTGLGARPSVSPALEPPGAVVLVGAGDIASCRNDHDERTARLLDTIGGTVFTLGDNAYESGSHVEFANCYEPTWGRHRERTRPAVGNHEYGTPGAAGHFAYFGPAAGDAGTGYYSYRLGDWHVVVLNSNCDRVGGCDAGSPQEQWLRADLAAARARCTVAYMHHPLFSSGQHGPSPELQAIWQALYESGAEIVLAAHDHDYERFAPQDPSGAPDESAGIRQFVVGTGGVGLRGFATLAANSEVRDSESFGVLRLTLRRTGYEWAFLPVAGDTFSDSGSGSCR